eukprot:scaffold1804_cov26-Phaeocystis_antarctica.AAC.1
MHASFQQLLQLQECLSTTFFLSVSPQALQMKNTIADLPDCSVLFFLRLSYVLSLLNKPTVPKNGTHHTVAVTKARLGISETTCTSSGEHTSGDHGRQRD